MNTKEICDVLLKLDLVTEEKLQTVYPDIYKPKVETGYKKIRMFDSDIYIYETNSNEYVDITLGEEDRLELLQNIDEPNKIENCKINCGFFNFDGSEEHLGLFMKDGKVYNDVDNTYINYLYYKNGTTKIKYITNPEELFYLQYDLKWGIGVGWSLINNGEIDLTNSEIWSHSKQKHPRTMLGQLFNGNFVLVVADGRSSISKGLTATEQAQVMKTLCCKTAVSLDGGGSSKMVVNNKVVNNCSEPNRKIGSSIIVCKK